MGNNIPRLKRASEQSSTEALWHTLWYYDKVPQLGFYVCWKKPDARLSASSSNVQQRQPQQCLCQSHTLCLPSCISTCSSCARFTLHSSRPMLRHEQQLAYTDTIAEHLHFTSVFTEPVAAMVPLFLTLENAANSNTDCPQLDLFRKLWDLLLVSCHAFYTWTDVWDGTRAS